MNIRKAQDTDLEQLSSLLDRYRIFYKQESSLELARSFLMDRFHQKDSIVFVGEEAGVLTGFTQLYPSFSTVSLKKLWILNDLFVHQDYRRRGIARKLMLEAMKFSQENEAKGLTLQTAIDNGSAQKLYESLGWVKNVEFYTYNFKH